MPASAKKLAAFRIESFPCDHSIDAVLTGFNSTRQGFKWNSKQKSSTYERNCIWMPLKLEKRENRQFLQNYFAFTLSTLVKYVTVLWKRLFWTLNFSAFTKTTDSFNKNKWCHMTLEGLSSVCAKLEPASSKNNEILEINVLQKFTSHSLYSILIWRMHS